MPTGIYDHSKRRGTHHTIKSILKMSNSHLGKKLSNQTKRKISNTLIGKKPKNLEYLHRINKGKNHGNWKGDNVGYVSLHSWVYRWKGKPNQCNICNAHKKEKRICWSNTNHKYKRILKDWIPLCYRCHQNFDKKNNNYPIKNKNQFS